MTTVFRRGVVTGVVEDYLRYGAIHHSDEGDIKTRNKLCTTDNTPNALWLYCCKLIPDYETWPQRERKIVRGMLVKETASISVVFLYIG